MKTQKQTTKDMYNPLEGTNKDENTISQQIEIQYGRRQNLETAGVEQKL